MTTVVFYLGHYVNPVSKDAYEMCKNEVFGNTKSSISGRPQKYLTRKSNCASPRPEFIVIC